MNDSQMTKFVFQLTGIEFPHDNDVLSGRGNSVNAHPGNQRYRSYVQMQKKHYSATPKGDKPVFAKLIVNTIRNLVPPGRFLIQDKTSELWSDIGDHRAWNKTRQALREKAYSPCDTNESTIPPPVDESPLANIMPTMPSASMMRLQSIFTRQLHMAALPLPSPMEQVQSDGFLAHNQYDPGPFFPYRSAPQIITPDSLNATHKYNTFVSPNDISWSTEIASPSNAPFLSENTVSNNDDKSMPDQNIPPKHDSIATPNDVPRSSEKPLPYNDQLFSENNISNNNDKSMSDDENATHQYDTITLSNGTPRSDEITIPNNALLFSGNADSNDGENLISTHLPKEHSTRLSDSLVTDFSLSSKDYNQLDPNDAEHDEFHIIADDVKQVTTNNHISEGKKSIIHDPCGEASPQHNTQLSASWVGGDVVQLPEEPVTQRSASYVGSDVAQLSEKPSTRPSASWTTDFLLSSKDIDQLDLSDAEHDYSHITADNMKKDNASDYISDGNSFMIDHCGKAFPLRNSFTRRGAEITIKDEMVPPMISEEVVGASEADLHLTISMEQSLEPFHNSNYRTKRSSILRNPKYSGPRASISSDENEYTSEGQDSIGFEPSQESVNSNDNREMKSLLRSLRLSEQRMSISTFGDYEDLSISNDNEDDSKFEADIEAVKRIRFSGINLISARSRRHSSLLSRRNSKSSNLGDLSDHSGRMSICENMSFVSGIFSMNEMELAEWQKEAAEWEKEAEMEDCQVLNENVKDVDRMTSKLSGVQYR